MSWLDLIFIGIVALYIDIIGYTHIDAKEILKKNMIMAYNMSFGEWLKKVSFGGDWDFKTKLEFKNKKFIFEGIILDTEDLGNLNYAVTGTMVLKRYDPSLILASEILRIGVGGAQIYSTFLKENPNRRLKEYHLNLFLYLRGYPLSYYMDCLRDQFWIEKGIRNFSRVIKH